MEIEKENKKKKKETLPVWADYSSLSPLFSPRSGPSISVRPTTSTPACEPMLRCQWGPHTSHTSPSRLAVPLTMWGPVVRFIFHPVNKLR